ncbi:MAG: 4-carboxymuconolactone decarboxylase [Conexibacter sp.]|nr:4-carboxymuconolactone decarboxylase [Conexibacter sp.]
MSSPPRIAPATGPQARLAVWFARRQLGPEAAESAAIYARHPRLMRAFALFNRAVDRPGRRVPDHVRKLAELKAATVVECAFCIDIGSEMARRSGLSDAQLLTLHDPEPTGLFSADELLVIAYAGAMSLTPPQVDDATVTALQQRYGDDGLLELTYLIAWENTRARLNHALGIGAGGFSAGRACALPASAREAATR